MTVSFFGKRRVVAGRFEHADFVFYLHHDNGILLTVYCFNVLHQFAESSFVCLKQVIAEGCAYL